MGSWSQTVQQDLRTVIEGMESGIIATPESILALPYGVATGDESYYTYSYQGDFTPEVAAVMQDVLAASNFQVGQLLGVTSEAIEGLFSLSQEMAEQAQVVTEALLAQQEQTVEALLAEVSESADVAATAKLGEPTITKYMPYALLGLLALLLLR